MTKREEFLAIQSYEEFDCRRDEFRDLKIDKETLEHFKKIFPKASKVNKEIHEDYLF